MKDEKSATDHTLDVTLKRVDELHHQVEELKTQLLTKGNRKNSSISKRRPWKPDTEIGLVQFHAIFVNHGPISPRFGIQIGPRISFSSLKFFADSDLGRF